MFTQCNSKIHMHSPIVYVCGIERKGTNEPSCRAVIEAWRMETMERVTDFIFLGSKITAESDCSHEIKRCLLLRRKAMTNLDSILKNRDITLPTKVSIVKSIVFSVVMYGCENWTIKSGSQQTDAFKLCWKRLLRALWTSRRSN